MMPTITYTIEPLGAVQFDAIRSGEFRIEASGNVYVVAQDTSSGDRVEGPAGPGDGVLVLTVPEGWLVEVTSSEEAEVTLLVTVPDRPPAPFPGSDGPTLFSHRPKLTRLRLSGVEMPAGSDGNIRCQIRLIDAAADLRRTVNADLINVARPVFRKYSVSISGADMHPAGLAALAPGDYVEVLLADPMSISLRTPGPVAELPRSGIDVRGITADGRKVLPEAQPVSPLPLRVDQASARIADLRARPSVTFAEPVSLVRYRAVLACVVVGWSTDYDERMADASWSLELEEV